MTVTKMTNRFKKSIFAALCVLLALCIGFLSSMQLIAEASEEVLYVEDVQLAVVDSGSNAKERAKKKVGSDYTVANKVELNPGTDTGKDVYLAYKTTTNKDMAIRDIKLMSMDSGYTVYDYKELNEEAQKAGLTYSSIKRLRMLLHFLSLKGYIYKQEGYRDSVGVRLQASQEVTMTRFERRTEICRFIIDTLNVNRDPSKDMTLVNFSVVELLKQYIASQQETMFAEKERPDIAEIEEALLYLTKTELMKIEGGFIVIYNTMQIGRIADRRARYGKEQYRLLDEFYKQRIRQIHIVGEYANLMVRMQPYVSSTTISPWTSAGSSTIISRMSDGHRLT